jgi:hypothetical protein
LAVLIAFIIGDPKYLLVEPIQIYNRNVLCFRESKNKRPAWPCMHKLVSEFLNLVGSQVEYENLIFSWVQINHLVF